MTSKTFRQVLQIGVAVLVVGLVAYFFRRQFAQNWSQFRHHEIRLAPGLLAASLGSLIFSYLVSTAMWRLAANRLATGRAFTFLESVGMVNTTQLTKYIPGKIWGYAMQMALVDRRSLSISSILYVNVLVTLTNSFLAVIAGGVYLTFSSRLIPLPLAVIATLGVLALYFFFLVLNGRFFAVLLKISSRVLRRRIEFFQLPPRCLAALQLLGLASAAAFGLSAVLGAEGTGFAMTASLAWPVAAGFLLADTIGFLAFFVPGGIGVREGLLYLLLSELGAGSIALVLPIVMRLVSMATDALLGLTGLVTLRSYVKERAP